MAKKKSKLGQVFLVDKNVVSRMLRVVGVQEGDWVVEVGPGKGILTEALLQIGANVIAFEIDRNLTAQLRDKFRLLIDDRLHIFQADYLKSDVGEVLTSLNVEKPYFISNIPYYITTPIMDKLIREKELYKTIHLTIQKEVAERVVAKEATHQYGSLTLYINYHFQPRIEFFITRKCFRPIPKVDSAFVSLIPRSTPPVRLEDEKLFFRVMRGSFSMRRKKLKTVLRAMFGDVDWGKLSLISGIDLNRRGETLSMEEFARLANAIFEMEHSN